MLGHGGIGHETVISGKVEGMNTENLTKNPRPLPPVAEKKYGVRVRDIHGTHFDDPWDWLRDEENPDVVAHLDAENAWADIITKSSSSLATDIVAEVKGHTLAFEVTVPIRYGAYWYFSRTYLDRDYRTHHRIAVTEGNEFPPQVDASTPHPDEELVLDENQRAEGQDFYRMGELAPNADGTLIAWSEDVLGNEHWTWIIKDASTGDIIDESVTGTGTGLAWSADCSAFMYSRVDDAWRQCELWVHTLGADPQTDQMIHSEADERFILWFAVGADPDHVAVHATSTTTSEAWLWSPHAPFTPPVPVTGRIHDVQVDIEPAGDHLLLVHTAYNREGTLAIAPLPNDLGGITEPFAPVDTWVTIRDAGPGERILDVEATGNFYLLGLRSQSLTHVEYATRNGSATVTLDSTGAVANPWGQPKRVEVESTVRTMSTYGSAPFDATTFCVAHESMTVPPTIESIEASTGQQTLLKEHEIPGWDASGYVEKRLWVTARDGHTQIPVTVVHRADIQPDGTNIGWVQGYGSYEISNDPKFSTLRLPLLARGVVHVIAHIRGGGEMGRSWHENGKELAKLHTFTDFIDVTQAMVELGYFHPDRIIAEGRSAGGLLMGAVTNLAPHLYRAVLAGVPFVDALTTMLDPSLPLTVGEWEEWGNPIEDRAIFDLISAYTPYENIVDGTVFPAIMATTSVNDIRVFHVEPSKWVQRLREASASDPYERPIIQRIEMVAGHGGPSGMENYWAARAEEFAFALDQAGFRRESDVSGESPVSSDEVTA